MQAARVIIVERNAVTHVIPFDDRPGKLFEGLQNCRSVILLAGGRPTGKTDLHTSRYMRWSSEARADLFARIEFCRILDRTVFPDQFPKYANAIHEGIFAKLRRQRAVVEHLTVRRSSSHYIFYQEATRYWVKASIGLPFYSKNGVSGAPAHGRHLHFESRAKTAAAFALLNSSLFYLDFVTSGDCFHLNDRSVVGFPIPAPLGTDTELASLGEKLMTDLEQSAERQVIRTKDGDSIEYAEYYASRSKPIIDEIDRLLAHHYGFTDEELDFIINYDIKYRMGKGAGDGDDE